MPTLDHNYGTSSQGAPALLPVPLNGGTVEVKVFNQQNKLIGKTRTDSSGRWLQSFDVPEGKYTVQFTGYFRPAGAGPSRNVNPVRSQQIEVNTQVVVSTGVGAGAQGVQVRKVSKELMDNLGLLEPQALKGLKEL